MILFAGLGYMFNSSYEYDPQLYFNAGMRDTSAAGAKGAWQQYSDTLGGAATGFQPGDTEHCSQLSVTLTARH